MDKETGLGIVIGFLLSVMFLILFCIDWTKGDNEMIINLLICLLSITCTIVVMDTIYKIKINNMIDEYINQLGNFKKNLEELMEIKL